MSNCLDCPFCRVGLPKMSVTLEDEGGPVTDLIGAGRTGTADG
jgi:hypothetical protein